MTRARSTLSWLPAALAAGFVFLYLPIVLLVLFSFNESRLVTVWAGFSTRWYGELLGNERMLAAAALSLGVAATAATLAGMAGTLAGYALARLGAFALRPLFALLLLVPMVLPEVILGLSMLMTFSALDRLIGWPAERGFLVVALAHATYGTAFVALIVEARLRGMDPALEEAALDLGASPARAFWRVSVPLLAPAIASGWLLAFTLSLDDLVVASFVAGPGATTLPMLVYSSVRLGLSPQINALATILVFAIAMLAFVSVRIDARVRRLST
ncbi:MAG: ABC transporter permease subunit [Tagaea sp.]|nr:ABC transporter permease subunit [Azospirillum sp.]MCA3267544.1 ABC transporter permease subunit [Azospirillum sp.]MCZ8123292.1 ABC transporter permease subunit [Magnetospirillum sp.]